MLFEFLNHLAGFQATSVGPKPLDQISRNLDQRNVVRNGQRDAGTQDFDGHFAAIVQHGKMHLSDRRAGYRRFLETFECFEQGLAVCGLQQGDGLNGWERRHLILQLGQLVGKIRRHQIAPGGEHLSEFDENRTQTLQSLPQTDCARL